MKGYKGWVMSLETRLRGVFKGFFNIKYTQFTVSDTGLRGHKLNIYKPHESISFQ